MAHEQTHRGERGAHAPVILGVEIEPEKRNAPELCGIYFVNITNGHVSIIIRIYAIETPKDNFGPRRRLRRGAGGAGHCSEASPPRPSRPLLGRSWGPGRLPH